MMRGVKKSQASMTTTAMLGVYKEDKSLRSAFIAQISKHHIDA